MANENKKVVEMENDVELNQETPVDDQQEMDGIYPEDFYDDYVDEKKPIIPKWLVKTARFVEAGAAIFGGVVGVLMIKDKFGRSSRKRKAISSHEIEGRRILDAMENPGIRTEKIGGIDVTHF